MKKFINILLCAVMVLSTAACSSNEESIYTSGTYSAKAKGFGGDVVVSITTDSTQITDVDIDASLETPSIGGNAAESLREAIIENQNVEVDVVTGATVTSNAVIAAAKKAISQAMGVEVSKTALTDGTYSTKSVGYSWTGMIYTDVVIENNAIKSITITEEHDSETGEMAATAYTNMIPRLLEVQSLSVDAISGATSTSNAIKDCVSQAIELAGGDASEWYTDIAKSNETIKLEGYDVIVVGLGGSGIMSYCAAAEEGATVFGIETTAKLGGQSATTTGPMVIDSKSPAFEGVTFANPDEVYQVWLDYVESDEKADIIHEAVYNSGKYLDYYIENFGLDFAGMILSFVRPQWSQFWTMYVGENNTSNIFGPNKTYQYNRSMDLAVAMNEKNDYKLELTAEELIYDNNEIVGVKATYYDGTTYEIYGDTVILATGGYIGNEEMVLENWGVMPNTVSSLVNDGTGIEMGLSAGGTTYMMGVDPMIHILQVPNLIKNDDLTANQKAILSALALVKGEKAVTINGTPLDPTWVEAQIPGYKYYNIYSEEQINSYKNTGLTENFAYATSMFMSQGGSFEVGKPISDMDTILEVGMNYNNVLHADSISELAKQIGCEEATLRETLGDNDTSYYAVAVSGYTYGSVGGLDVDINMNVLREDGTAISNLYAVGTDSMGVENIEGKPYTPWGGQAHAWIFTSGYLGGKAAAKNGMAK
ncbi:MAG: FMN-binding protein [Erysipelotrichales bacterium]|nr:FMN-binding protein [Erysipelotrichales bacterium]